MSLLRRNRSLQFALAILCICFGLAILVQLHKTYYSSFAKHYSWQNRKRIVREETLRLFRNESALLQLFQNETFLHAVTPEEDERSDPENGLHQIVRFSDLVKQAVISNPCSGYGDLVVANPEGRLGNQIFKFASLLIVQKCLGIQGALAEPGYNTLSDIFTGISKVISLPKQCVTFIKPINIHTCQVCNSSRDKLIAKRKSTNARKRDYKIMLYGYAICPKIVHQMKEFVLEELKFRKDVLAPVQKMLQMIAAEAKTDSKIHFVGVHIRRTDYEYYMDQHCKEHIRIKPAWYVRAFQRMKMRLGPGEIRFIVASDAINMTKIELPEEFGPFYFVEQFHLMANESGVSEEVFDLAAMSSCDASIFDFGTYGFWGALFTGGPVIYSTYTCTPKPGIRISRLGQEQEGADANWEGLPIIEPKNDDNITQIL